MTVQTHILDLPMVEIDDRIQSHLMKPLKFLDAVSLRGVLGSHYVTFYVSRKSHFFFHDLIMVKLNAQFVSVVFYLLFPLQQAFRFLYEMEQPMKNASLPMTIQSTCTNLIIL